MSRSLPSARPMVVAAMIAFAAFGAFWGAWGASIPRVRVQAGLDDAGLGVALLFVGAGALPAMLLTGRAIDRWGLRVAAVAIALLGGSGVVVALVAGDLVSLSVALTLVGVTSGASDVAMNSVAGRAERDARRPVITRAHGVFSSFVVIASLGTGLLTGAGAPIVTPFVLVAITALLAATLMARVLPAGPDANAPAHPVTAGDLDARVPVLPTLSLIGLGLLGALAFASENAHQSWSAIFATDALGASAAVGAIAPAVFASAAAITRFSTGGISAVHARPVIAVGAAVATAGAVVIAYGPNLVVNALGLALAAAGTAVLFPMILSVVSTRVDETNRGRATSTVSTVAYLGFLLGPSYVGFWSDAVGLRGAMLAVAALGGLLLLFTPLIKSVPRGAAGPTPRDQPAPETTDDWADSAPTDQTRHL
ncbi:MFS transporter [Saxibacter everestensis]|uniref:MFS transporter n=1 Tax=Saxibacter everestensis TaxID=2909229 RepID=A0ABY8QY34_9MICO|nr:MFS transporter [Brevibacteriaceae bacterium ZFBP1038]